MVPNMYGVKSMRVARFVIQETGTYNQQYRRPYEAQLTSEAKNTILDTIDRTKSISATTMAGVSNLVLSARAAPESNIMIPNGWGTRRLRFFMEIVTEDRTGMMHTSEYIVGYTDHCGLSLSNHIDPNMVFYINGVNITRTRTMATPLGNQVHHNLLDASHVLVNNQYEGMYGNNKVFTLRPEDVYDQMDNRELAEGLDGFAVDGRTMLTSSATKSNRGNAIVPNYVASLLNSYLQISRDHNQADQGSIIRDARSTVQSGTISEDPFMSFVRGKYAMSGGDHFTYQDLLSLDPNVVNVTHVAPVNEALRGSMHHMGQTADWGSSDLTTQAATQIAQSLPSYMLQFGINKLRMHSTNLDIGGVITTIPSDVRSFNSGEDLTRNIQALIFRMEHELMRGITFNGSMGYMLEVTCDLLGETWINLSLNGEPPTCYVAPSFCDALMAPVVTSNFTILDGLANDFDALMKDIIDRDSSLGFNSYARAGAL